VGPSTGLDCAENKKLLIPPGFEIRPLCRPARSQSLSRLLLLIEVRPKIMPGNSIPQFDFKFPNFDHPSNESYRLQVCIE
jgi:hypothetical protein